MSNFFKKISTIMTALSLCFNISGTSSFAVENSDFNIVKKTSEKSNNKVLVKSFGVALILTIIGSLAYFCMKNNNDETELADVGDVDVGLELYNYILENLRKYSSQNNSDLEFFEDKNSFDKDKKIDLNGFDEKNIIFVEVKSFEGMRLLGSIFSKNKQDKQSVIKSIKASTFGCSGTGKTLFSKYANDSSLNKNKLITIPTLGCEFTNICFKLFIIKLWDIAGDEKYESISSQLFKDSEFGFGFFNEGNEVDFNDRLKNFININIAGNNVKCLIIKNSINDLKNFNE